MKYIILLLMYIFVVGCGDGFNTSPSTPDPRSIHGIDQSFSYEVSLFESLYGASIGDVSIGFQDLEGNVVGLCTRWSSGYKQVAVDPQYWSTADPYQRINLILHELGHCVLNREHVNGMRYYSGTHIRGNVPVSLMYPYNFMSSSYAELDNSYYYELFHPTEMSSTVDNLKSKEQVEIPGCVHIINDLKKGEQNE